VDVSGAVLAGPDEFGFFSLKKAGFVAPEYLELLPGVKPPSPRFPLHRIPCNLVGPLKGPTTNDQGWLRDYQIEMADNLLATPRGAVNALSVGLGKTRATVAAAGVIVREHGGPIVVIGPLKATSVWCSPTGDPAEYGLRIIPVRTERPDSDRLPAELAGADGPSMVDGYFLNYEIAPYWTLALMGLDPTVLIVDEAHYIRNPKTLVSKELRKISRMKSIRLRVAMTATPVVNSVADLWAILDLVQPGLWGSWLQFRIRYAGAVEDEYGWHDKGETNVDELKGRLARTLFRRDDEAVRAQLPPLTRQVTRISLDDLTGPGTRDDVEAYRRLHQRIRANLPGDTKLELYGKAAQLLSTLKRNLAVEEALEMVYEYGKLVVFGWYRETVAHICKALRKEKVKIYGPVTSNTSHAMRLKLMGEFADASTGCTASAKLGDPAARGRHVFVATLGTAGEALNELCAAPAVLFCDLYWVPSTFIQAEGRVRRQGQKAARCFAQYLLVEHSMDEVMYELLAKKARSIANVNDDEEAMSLCESLGGSNKQQDFERLVAALAGLSDGTGELR